MERRKSGHQSSRGSLREIVEEPRESPLPAEEEAVYVAVEKEIREWSDNFLWVLRNTSKEKKIVIVHVHRPAHRIPTVPTIIIAHEFYDALLVHQFQEKKLRSVGQK